MKYPEEKAKIIRKYDDEYIINFIDEIKNREMRGRLNKILIPFVSDELKHENDNTKKFGKKTKGRFCKALKGNLEGFFADSKRSKKVSPEEKVLETLPLVYAIWVSANSALFKIIDEYILLKKIEKENLDFGDIDLLKFLCKKNKEYLISKETIKKFYDFGPIVPSPELNKLIENCKTRLDIIQYLDKKPASAAEIARYEAELNSKDEAISLLSQKIEDKNQELDYYQDEVGNLKKKIKQFENTNIDKMKQNFEEQLIQKENEINGLRWQLEDYDEVVSQNESLQAVNKTLEQYRKLDIRDFHAQIENKDFRKFLKHLILSDEKTSKLVVKKLNLKEELLLEADKIYEQKFIDENIELEELRKQKAELSKEISDLEMQKNRTLLKESIITNNTDIIPQDFSALIKEGDFKEKFRHELKKTENDYDLKLYEKLKTDNIIIVEDKKDIEIWLGCQRFGCNPLEVVVEYDWTSYRDWFGFYDEDNNFIPSNTLIADYYKLIKSTPDLPLGVIIFNDFNKILPEIYLEPFFQNIEIKGFLDLLHPDMAVKKEDEIFKRIEIPANLKFILIKSKSEDAFGVPLSFKKYEVL